MERKRQRVGMFFACSFTFGGASTLKQEVAQVSHVPKAFKRPQKRRPEWITEPKVKKDLAWASMLDQLSLLSFFNESLEYP